MGNIQLDDGRIVEPHYGRNIDKAPSLLDRWKKGEGYIPSEADVRLEGIRNFKNAPEIATNYWDSSTLYAGKDDDIKIILPYDNLGNHQLTESAELALSLINPSEDLVAYGVNLDVDNRWEKLDGNGVYVRKREDWFEKDDEGNLIGFNKYMKEEYAHRCPIILTKFGCPEFVDKEFWMVKGEKRQSIDKIHNLIHYIFELGKKECGYGTMMGQYLPNESKKGILKAWYAYGLDYGARSDAGANLDDDDGRFAFISVGDADSNNDLVDVDEAIIQLDEIKKVVSVTNYPVDAIEDEIKSGRIANKKLSNLTIDSIYSAIQQYTLKKDESEVKGALEKLLNQQSL